MIALKESGDGSAGELRRLDLSSCRFPSDSLSIKALRTLHPDLFDKGFSNDDDPQPKYLLKPHDGGHVEDSVGNMLYCERVIVVAAFAEAKGIAQLDINIADIKEDLQRLYERHGLAHGSHESHEMIRGLESQGRDLAKTPSR
jgi:hypothetical protein